MAAAEALVPELAAAGGSGQAVHLDVADAGSWSALADEVAAAGPLHGLVNNAGVSLRAGIADTTVEQWQRVMDINLSSVFYGLKTLTPALARGAEDGGAAVVNVSSIAGMVGYFSATYGTSKWGVRGLSKVGALELAAHGIRVNSLHPGLTSTPCSTRPPTPVSWTRASGRFRRAGSRRPRRSRAWSRSCCPTTPRTSRARKSSSTAD